MSNMRLFDGIVTDVITTTKGEVFGSKIIYGEPLDRMVLIKYIVLDQEGNSIGKGSDAYNLNYSPRSNMHRFINLYGAPERGRMVKVFKKDGFFRIFLE